MKIQLLAFALGCSVGLAYGDVCQESCWTTEEGYDTYSLGGATSEWLDGSLVIKPGGGSFDVNYTLYPGARPRAGATGLKVVTEPLFEGSIKAEFKGIGCKDAQSAVAQKGAFAHDFCLNFPSNNLYQLTKLVFSPHSESTAAASFALKKVDWLFDRSAAGSCRVEPRRLSNKLPVFHPVGGADPAICFCNTSDSSHEWQIDVVLTNYFGAKLSRSFRSRVGPGETTCLEVPEARQSKCLWYAEADIRAEDGSVAHGSARLAVIDSNPVSPRLANGKFRFGMNFHMGRYSGKAREYCFDALNALGVKLVRGGAFGFSTFQPHGPDEWITQDGDEWMAQLKSRGLDVDAIFNYSPKWAQDERHRALAREKNWTYGSYSRTIPGAMGQFVEKLARRYGTDIAYYELGNEWDLIDPDVLTIDEGISFLKETHAGLKRGNPEALLTTCGFAYGTSEDGPGVRQTNMHERVTAEARGSYDIHAVHAHCHEPHFAKRINSCLEMRRRLGDTTPWYLNEAGISSFHGMENIAVEYVWIKILYSWARGSRDYIWYNLRATGWNPKDSEQGFGVLTPDWNPRPAFVAYAALSHLLSGYSADGILSDGELQVYRFRNDEGMVVVAGWNSVRDDVFRISDGPARAERVDFMGNRTSVDGERLCFGRVPCAYVLGRMARLSDSVVQVGDDISTGVRDIRTTTFDRPWQLAEESAHGTAADAAVTVDVSRVEQEMLGFGTAVSELSWKSLSLLPEAERKKALDEMFSPGGGNFTVVRTPIGSSDFALDYYSYDDHPGDFEMKRFSVERDEQCLLPLLREVVRRVPPDVLKVWASPWCPPKWMKRTGCYASCPPWKGGRPNDCPPEARVFEGEDGFSCDDAHLAAYARYFRRYVDAYRAAEVPIWMVMPQNEFNSAQPYPSCTWKSRSMATFIGKHLGPALEGSGVELHFGTVERSSMEIVNAVLGDPDCRRYVKGVGFQWGGKGAIVAVHSRYPDVFLMQTEQECGDGKNDWLHARHCWDLMRHYLCNGASAYEYWNMSLCDDSQSRWGWSQNSLVTVSPADRSWRFNIEYYVLKHVSHYVVRGSRRLATDGYDDALAFATPRGSVVAVLGNDSDEAKVVEVVVRGDPSGGARLLLPPNSLTTMLKKGRCQWTGL